jgi:periplasmic copper chaperone A
LVASAAALLVVPVNSHQWSPTVTRRTTRLAVALIATPIAAIAQPSALKIDHVWSRTAPIGHEGVVYLTISNSGSADRLIGVTTPEAEMAHPRQSSDDHGVMKMRDVSEIPIGTGKTVTLAPLGMHIMLMTLKRPHNAGDRFPSTLRFAEAGDVTAMVTVEKGGAAKPTQANDDMGMGDMPMPAAGQR